jgi:hypothetical protein
MDHSRPRQRRICGVQWIVCQVVRHREYLVITMRLKERKGLANSLNVLRRTTTESTGFTANAIAQFLNLPDAPVEVVVRSVRLDNTPGRVLNCGHLKELIMAVLGVE